MERWPAAQAQTTATFWGREGCWWWGQVALSMVLLIGAALLIESLARCTRVDPGFQTSHLLTMNITLPESRYDTDEKKARFYRELVEHAESLPGVRSAAVTLNLPMTDTWVGQPVQLAGIPPLRLNERPIGVTQNISPEYFRTLAITLKRGRKFTAQDNATSVPVAIVNENLARLFWPQYPLDANPVGQTHSYWQRSSAGWRLSA